MDRRTQTPQTTAAGDSCPEHGLDPQRAYTIVCYMYGSNPEKYKGLTINLAAEQMDGEQLAATYSKIMGREIKFQQLPRLITRLVMGRDLAKMFRWVDNNDALFVKDLQALKNEFPGMLSLEDWIRMHFKKT